MSSHLWKELSMSYITLDVQKKLAGDTKFPSATLKYGARTSVRYIYPIIDTLLTIETSYSSKKYHRV
jgi:hypothetical protein